EPSTVPRQTFVPLTHRLLGAQFVCTFPAQSEQVRHRLRQQAFFGAESARSIDAVKREQAEDLSLRANSNVEHREPCELRHSLCMQLACHRVRCGVFDFDSTIAL